MRDISNDLIVKQGLIPKTHSAGAVTQTNIDMKGAREALLCIEVGVVASGGTLDIVVTTASTSGGTYSAVATVPQIVAAGSQQVKLTGLKRYVKVVSTVAVAAVDAAVVIVGANPRYSKGLVA